MVRTGSVTGEKKGPGSESQKRRLRRLNDKATKFLISFMREMMLKRILPVRSVGGATDVRRLAWLASELRKLSYPGAAVAAVLVLDWAARTPEYTETFVDETPVWTTARSTEALLRQYRKGWKEASGNRYWHGRLALNTAKFLLQAPLTSVVELGFRLSILHSRARMSQLLDYLSEMPFLGTYSSYALLRGVGGALGIRFRDSTFAAENMSLHTSLLASILPLAKATYHLKTADEDRPCIGFSAWVFCETAKILRHEAVLEPLDGYRDHKLKLLVALTGPRAKQVLQKAKRFAVMTVSETKDSEVEELERITGDDHGGNHTGGLKMWKLASDRDQPPVLRKRPAAA